MGSMSVSSCISCMLVSCMHPVAVLNVVLCMPCSLLMLVEDARGDRMEETYSRDWLLPFTLSCCCKCFFIICSGLYTCTEML